MTNDEFDAAIDAWMRQNPGRLQGLLPEGSGLLRIANVDWSGYNPAHISLAPGRWTPDAAGQYYLSSSVNICAAELGYFDEPVPPERVIEHCRLTRAVEAVDLFQLPKNLRDELYNVRDPATKWEKPHRLINRLRNDPVYGGIHAISGPSASGMALDISGTCLMVPRDEDVEVVEAKRFRDWGWIA